MPGHLLSFIRTSPSSSPKLDHVKPHPPPNSSLPPYSVSRPSTLRTKSAESVVMDAFKRHSIGGGKKTPKSTPKSTPRSSPHLEAQKGATLSMEIESPPIVFYNRPESSTGAILSGQLKFDIKELYTTLEKFEMNLTAVVTTKKPVMPHCHECSTQTTDVHKWEFLQAPVSLRHGVHAFPFSHLLPGHLPATTHAPLATLEYVLKAVATTTTGEKIKFQRNLEIRRAIFPGAEKHSIRIFPPTNLTATVTLPPVIHPIGDFGLEMRLSGITQTKGDSQTRWRLRKLNWRIEETYEFVAPACAKHISKVGGEGKGVKHEDTRVVGSDEVKIGWKTDFDDGNIDAEFRASCNPALKAVCDMESTNGMKVRHNLIIEMVVAEEWAPLRRLNQATPTGAARVLRTQFHLVLTERAGLGISWDEEQPPVYEDVPASPPIYQQEYDDLERLEDEHPHLRL